MSPMLNYVDTRDAKEHGRISGQTPADSIEVMEDTEISLNVFRYPTDKAQKNIEILLPNNEGDITVRVVLQASNSDFEITAFEKIYPQDLDRKQSISLNIPDNRVYQCTVYENGEAEETFTIGNESDE